MPFKELKRLQAVHRFLKLEFSKNHELQEIVDVAAQVCGTETALITLIGENTQYIKFQKAFEFETTLRSDAFCNQVIELDDLLIIPDTLADDRFVTNPLVAGVPYIRFYAGAPLITSEGENIGSLCVIDPKPGSLTENQQVMLKAMAKQVIQLMDFEETLSILKEQYIDSKRAEIELQSFFESSIDHHLLLGKNFEILAFNKAWDRHVNNKYGLHLEKGKSMIDYIHQDHLRRFYKDYTTALKGTAVYDQRNLPQEGKDHWRMVKFEPAFNAEGEIIGVSVNVADVNKKVENENTVKIQSAQLQEIAFLQSHELRKPVASILGLIDLIKMDGRCDDLEEWQMLEKAVEELDHKIRTIVGRTIE